MRRKGYNKKCSVYILECKSMSKNKKKVRITYYTGISNNLERRLQEHKNNTGKGARYTRNKKIKMVHFEQYSNRALAFRREYQIKKYGHKRKKQIIAFKTPQCPQCEKPLISSTMRATKNGWADTPYANLTDNSTKEKYYSCTNKCITNVSSSLLKSYTKRMKGEIK